MSSDFKDSEKKVIFKKAPMWVTSFSAAILAMIILASVFAVNNFGSSSAAPTASAQHNLEFFVFYQDNAIFDQNPISPHMDFLMSYTDYIEVQNRLAVNFSEETTVFYTYSVIKRLIIRPLGSDRIVFEEIFVLSDTYGQVETSRMIMGSLGNGENGTASIVASNGSYILDPKLHIETYRTFVIDQTRQMADENVVVQGFSGFTADLLIDFTYTIHAPDLGIREQLIAGYRMPLTTEVYSLLTTGISSFESVSDEIGWNVSLPVAIIFVFIFSGLVFGLLHFIKEMKCENGYISSEVSRILRKYERDIVSYPCPVDISNYKLMQVQNFDDLLKLSISQNKHIMSYKNDEFIEFIVVVDDFACTYRLDNGT